MGAKPPCVGVVDCFGPHPPTPVYLFSAAATLLCTCTVPGSQLSVPSAYKRQGLQKRPQRDETWTGALLGMKSR